MKHHVFGGSTHFPVTLLFKENAFNKKQIEKYYIEPLKALGVPPEHIMALTLDCAGKSPKASEIKSYLPTLYPVMESAGTKHILIAESAYFKNMTKERQAEAHLGYMKDVPGTDFKITYGYSYPQVQFDDTYKGKLQRSLETLAKSYHGTYTEDHLDIIHKAIYPTSVGDVASVLDSLHMYPMLTFDLETFSLNIHKAGIGTIAFAWNQHEGTAFCVDYKDALIPEKAYGMREVNEPIRQLLKQFFLNYKGRLIAHNASYDVKVCIYNLFMEHALDYKGMIDALDVFKRIDDTKLIAYLALNSTDDYRVGLKALAHEFAGNYGQDNIHDITLIERNSLLEYNLKDCLCTWYVYNKYYPVMVQDEQLQIYEEQFLPSLRTVIEMEIVGLPVDPQAVHEVHDELSDSVDRLLKNLLNTSWLKEAKTLCIQRHMDKRNSELKKKQLTFEEAAAEYAIKYGEFNFDSDPQMRVLLYDVLQFPVIDLTKSKEPSVSTKTLDKFKNIEQDEDKIKFIEDLIDLSALTKIMSSFMPTFVNAFRTDKKLALVNGCFNLGATVSGRLSSSDPNMQQLPANGTYAKLIKSMVYAFDGWVFCGADFNALEDRINTLLTKDPNKLAVYVRGFDGHCLRSYSYFTEQMPDITAELEAARGNPDFDKLEVQIINSIDGRYSKLRKKSKSPSFAMQYGGTFLTLIKNCGFTEEEALEIEARYHRLYEVSDAWVASKLNEVCEKGYATLCFGLRLRAPLLFKAILSSTSCPRQAHNDARSVGNALSGQSYCQLTNRASNEFMSRVRASKYRYDVLACMWIHDAIYLMVKNDIETIKWVNDNLIECMEWQDLPEIQHDQVKLGAELDLYYPTWNDTLTLPNKISQSTIVQRVDNYILNGYKVPEMTDVLCIKREALNQLGTGIHELDLNTIDSSMFTFMPRKKVDDKSDKGVALGYTVPQLLPYVTVHCGEHIYMYSRKKGNESRLHGSLSIGFGGHVDGTDFSDAHGFIDCLKTAAVREMEEELGIQVGHLIKLTDFSTVIIDTTNDVGKVHLGIHLSIEVPAHEAVYPNLDEIHDPKWVDTQWLKDNIDYLENWSKMIVETL